VGERITKKHVGRRVRAAEDGVREHWLVLDIIEVRGDIVRALIELQECRICPVIWRVVEVLD
jgi:hypothetical protein